MSEVAQSAKKSAMRTTLVRQSLTFVSQSHATTGPPKVRPWLVDARVWCAEPLRGGLLRGPCRNRRGLAADRRAARCPCARSGESALSIHADDARLRSRPADQCRLRPPADA